MSAAAAGGTCCNFSFILSVFLLSYAC
jgi:hypothetical protein